MNNEYVKPNDYVEAYKHLIGCEVVNIFGASFIITQEWLNETESAFGGLPDFVFKSYLYYLDEDTLGTYEEYMELHYKVWI